jgi:membrane-associated phospholipid phosphatase
MKTRLVLALTAISALATANAWADPVPLGKRHSDAYYAWHVGLTAGGIGLSGLESVVFAHHGPGPYWGDFFPDNVLSLTFSESAASLSDRLLLTSLSLPVFVQMSQGFDRSMGNATLIYAEAHSLNLFLTTTTKYIVRRPRPYTQAVEARIQEFADNEGGDAYVSFFSGHSRTAFTSAMAGSLLYAARTDEIWSRRTVWGLEFLLAGTTAQLRVRAGRHYQTDVLTGMVVGLGVGYLVPKLHHVDTARVSGSEVLIAALAGGIPMIGGAFVSFCDTLDLIGACNMPRDVRIPVQPSRDLETGARWFVLPAVFDGGAGLQMAGEL